MVYRHIIVDEDSYQMLSALKGPNALSFRAVVADLLDSVFPVERGCDPHQTKLDIDTAYPKCGYDTITRKGPEHKTITHCPTYKRTNMKAQRSHEDPKK